jgi:molybdopterin/thiamine biosynthesis adenylyltransferase
MQRDRSSKYDRQERLSLWDQNIISNSTILIAGVGGTGSEVAKNLALLGVGNLIIIDSDTIEFSNLNRQMLFREEDIGQKKASIAKKRIKDQFNPDIKIQALTEMLQNAPQNIFEKADIFAGCVDNFLARQYLNSMSIELNKPLIDSATDGFFGQVQYIKPKFTACLACDNPHPPEETRVLNAPCTLVGIPRERDHCAWKALYEFNNQYNREPSESSSKDIHILTTLANKYALKYKFGIFEERELSQLILFHVPSLITVNAVISGIQSQDIIKALFIEKRSQLKEKTQKNLQNLQKKHRFRIPSFQIYSALAGTINTFDLVKDPDCLVCGQGSSHKSLFYEIQVDKNAFISEIPEIIGQKKLKQYIYVRGFSIVPENTIIKNALSDGDRITLSSLSDDEEIRVKIRFK